ncbi:MAG TPA: hypothetical protein VEQ40_07760, partial [Pyrinomonadaceae bacterium]|nr:hypothetical protein [Pyrinomonadaceae bacterium]
MKNKFIISFVALVLLTGTATTTGFGQRRTRTTPTVANQAASPLTSLPASDAVMLIDIKRLLNDAV